MLRKAHIKPEHISDREIGVFYAISKMTIIDEMGARSQYFSLAFVEFQEFLARVANFLFNPLG